MGRNIKISDKSGHNVDLKPILKKLIPFASSISESRFPLVVNILHKENEMDHSYYNPDTNVIILKVNPEYLKERIDYIFSHEFFHFIQCNSEVVQKADSEQEEAALYKILQKTMDMDEEQVGEIFHDFLPREAEANTFAAMITGVHFKRHKFETAVDALKKKGIMEAIKDGPRIARDNFYTHNGIRPPGVYSYHNTTQGHQTPYDDVWEDSQKKPKIWIKRAKYMDSSFSPTGFAFLGSTYEVRDIFNEITRSNKSASNSKYRFYYGTLDGQPMWWTEMAGSMHRAVEMINQRYNETIVKEI